jgi:hypothetical protein
MYESEHTQFIRAWLAKHPEQLEERRKGRALWWDKPQDPELTEPFRSAEIPTYPYYYDADSAHHA